MLALQNKGEASTRVEKSQRRQQEKKGNRSAAEAGAPRHKKGEGMKRRDTRMVKCLKCGHVHLYSARKVDPVVRASICPRCKSEAYTESGK